MNHLKRIFFVGALCSAMTMSLSADSVKQGDTISIAQKTDEKAGIDIPSIFETKDIAEKAFIYGLPIVMNYAVMQEFAVDKNSGQFKAPFNSIYNDAHVFTYKDTAVDTPNSDTPYSMLWSNLRAEPMMIAVPAVGKERYYLVQLIDDNAYHYGFMGSRATGVEADDYLLVGPYWKGENPAGIKQVFHSTILFSFNFYAEQKKRIYLF